MTTERKQIFSVKSSRDKSTVRILNPRELNVTTVPSNATVELDGFPVGKTPLTLRFVDYRRHKLVLEKESYHPLCDEFNFEESMSGTTLNFHLELHKDFEEYQNYIFVREKSTGIIFDTKTGLEWLVGPDKDTSWEESRKWINSLDKGWRFPISDELQNLFHRNIEWKQWGPFENAGWWVWADSEYSDEDRKCCAAFVKGFSTWHGDSESRNMTRVFAVRKREIIHADAEQLRTSAEVPSALSSKSFTSSEYPSKPQLVIRSFPSAASVYIDEEFSGKTPLYLSDIEKNTFRIRIEKDIFRPWEESIEFYSGEGSAILRTVLQLMLEWVWHCDGQLISHKDRDVIYQYDTGLHWKFKDGRMTYKEAIDWVKELGNSWRLPSIIELTSLHDSGFSTNLFSRDFYRRVLSCDLDETGSLVKTLLFSDRLKTWAIPRYSINEQQLDDDSMTSAAAVTSECPYGKMKDSGIYMLPEYSVRSGN